MKDLREILKGVMPYVIGLLVAFGCVYLISVSDLPFWLKFWLLS